MCQMRTSVGANKLDATNGEGGSGVDCLTVCMCKEGKRNVFLSYL